MILTLGGNFHIWMKKRRKKVKGVLNVKSTRPSVRLSIKFFKKAIPLMVDTAFHNALKTFLGNLILCLKKS